MAISVSSQFAKRELSFCEMLDNGGILVGDRWFHADSSEIDRTRYLTTFLRRQERNKRRRERRKSAVTQYKYRHGPRCIPIDRESQLANRLPLERRKCSRRSTLSECPTVNEIRTAWHYRNESATNRIRLGGMLLDLECYVDNSLITIVRRNLLMIVGRHGGLKAWIRENCPELLPHYKSLQRIKGYAKCLRQRLDVLDPVPIAALMDEQVNEDDIVNAEVHVQPRATEYDTEPVRNRFAWERSDVQTDACGRPYFHNENYFFVRLSRNSEFAGQLSGIRTIFKAAISLNDAEKCTNETYSIVGPGKDGGLGGSMKEMFQYIGRHPEFLAEVGVELAKDVGSGLKDVVLPERTKSRIANGERVGVGKLAVDLLEAYWRNVYEPCLVYRWGWCCRKYYDE